MKFRTIMLVIGCLMCIGLLEAKAQEKYPKGLYMSFEEIVNKTPSVTDEVEVIKRTSFDIVMVGGNDYKLKSATLSKRVLKKKAFAYSDGDSLYINCRKYKAQPWYAKVTDAGEYLVFSAGMSKISKKSDYALLFFGALGGAAAAQIRYMYAVKIDGNEFDIIDLDFLDKALKGKSCYGDFEKDRNNAKAANNRDQRDLAYKMIADKYLPMINK